MTIPKRIQDQLDSLKPKERNDLIEELEIIHLERVLKRAKQRIIFH